MNLNVLENTFFLPSPLDEIDRLSPLYNKYGAVARRVIFAYLNKKPGSRGPGSVQWKQNSSVSTF